jgi:type I restriction enzyme M protein
MNATFKDIEKLESDLWEAADNLRANSKLTSNDYFMPVLGVIFLRHAANRFQAAHRQIEEDQAADRMPKRKLMPADYLSRRALWLPEQARYDWIMERAATSESDLAKLVTDAMIAIEGDFEPLQGVLPKDFGIFEPTVLEDLMRLYNSEQIRRATGDVFGRIYEYFLARFSIQKAHDNGEFFTPSSIVQMIVNVIEPDHGTVFDPASGSGGMFVQSSHFIEHEGGDTAKKVVFYGQEKNPDTIAIAKMNLAVHGLEGKIAEAITYYQDEHSLLGRCDFVMANPPFNVDLVDAERIKSDPRLPFGLPGVNKQKKVSNANYLWISYFWSYLNDTGRAGFVMSSQASGAGHTEREVRQKLIETGDVDAIVSIRSGFFYTRSVPCELWFFDRGRSETRRDQVLMLDARNVYRKVTRKIYDFSPEQMQNLSAIVWLYRGQQSRYLDLIRRYYVELIAQSKADEPALAAFETALAAVRDAVEPVGAIPLDADDDEAPSAVLKDVSMELSSLLAPYEADRSRMLDALKAFEEEHAVAVPQSNASQHAARTQFDPIASAVRGLIKQVDLLYKLASRLADAAVVVTNEASVASPVYDRRSVARLLKRLDNQRQETVEQLWGTIYVYRQISWLHERFPDAELCAVAGLVRVVERSKIEASDWSLSPSRYVGVAPPEEDEDFDFEQTLRDIHTELADLNGEAEELAETIQTSFAQLGI